MNLSRTEVLLLSPDDWAAAGDVSAQYTAQQKGLAIDHAIKAVFGGESSKYAPFDMSFTIDNCTFHEVKSTTTKWIKISHGEIKHMNDELEKGNDTLIWAIDQLEAMNEYRIFALAKFSIIKPFIFQSTYETCWVVSKYTMQEHGEPI